MYILLFVLIALFFPFQIDGISLQNGPDVFDEIQHQAYRVLHDQTYLDFAEMMLGGAWGETNEYIIIEVENKKEPPPFWKIRDAHVQRTVSFEALVRVRWK